MRQIMGAIAQYDKCMVVLKLRGAASGCGHVAAAARARNRLERAQVKRKSEVSAPPADRFRRLRLCSTHRGSGRDAAISGTHTLSPGSRNDRSGIGRCGGFSGLHNFKGDGQLGS